MKTVLFVCTGNTCRSPMAAELFNATPTEGWRAVSCGLATSDGLPISQNAKAVLAEHGITSSHTTRTIREEYLDDADMIIGMTESHVRILQLHYPQFSWKIHVFPLEIEDPYGGDMVVYRQCLDEIIRGIKSLAEMLT